MQDYEQLIILDAKTRTLPLSGQKIHLSYRHVPVVDRDAKSDFSAEPDSLHGRIKACLGPGQVQTIRSLGVMGCCFYKLNFPEGHTISQRPM